MAVWTIDPLVAVIVIVNVPLAEDVHERVEVTETPRVTVEGVIVQVRPLAGDTANVSTTLPVKPLRALVRTGAVPVAGLAITTLVAAVGRVVKSFMVKVTRVARACGPLVPNTLTL